MLKLLTLITLTAGLAAAQTTPEQFTGIHHSSDPCGQPITTNGENGCLYGGSIATDPAAATATLYDSTGTTFPCQTTNPSECIDPHGTPPTLNLSGPWSGSMNWGNGQGLSGTVVIASGTCYNSGGPVSSTLAIYTVNCAGVDTVGQAASKSIKYASVKTTSRSGPAWQQLAIYFAFNQPTQWPQLAFYVPYPTPAAPAAPTVSGDPGEYQPTTNDE